MYKLNRESVTITALKYTERHKFKEEAPKERQYALRHGFLADITKHMVSRKKHSPWDDSDKLSKEAKKYTSRGEFLKGSKNAYGYALRHGKLDEICKHMKPVYNTWDRKSVLLVSKKYTTRKEFIINEPGAYNYAKNNDMLDEVYAHMVLLGDKYKRFIYHIIFPTENSVYVGLTFNLKKRKQAHIIESSNKWVKELISKGKPVIWVYSKEIYLVDEAVTMERDYIEYFKRNGYIVLNIIRGGGLGSRLDKWNIETVEMECKKYGTRTELREKSPSVYNFLIRNDLLESQLLNHMGPRTKGPKKITKKLLKTNYYENN